MTSHEVARSHRLERPVNGELKTVRVWLSASVDTAGPERAKIEECVGALSRELFRRGAQLVHGSQPNVRDHLLSAAADYKQEIGAPAPLTLAVSRYYSKDAANNGIDLDAWRQVCSEPPIVTREGLGSNDDEVKRQRLELLRQTLLEQCNVMIALGGKWWQVAADRPGVPKEIDLAEGDRLPLFLLGGLGGATKDYLAARPELLQRCHNGLTQEENVALFSISDMRQLAK